MMDLGDQTRGSAGSEWQRGFTVKVEGLNSQSPDVFLADSIVIVQRIPMFIQRPGLETFNLSMIPLPSTSGTPFNPLVSD